MKATFNIAALAGGAISKDREPNETDELRSKNDELRRTCFNNLSAVYAKEGDWQRSLEKAQKVIEQDEKNAKALFRIGSAYRHLRNFNAAEEYLKKAQAANDTAGVRNE